MLIMLLCKDEKNIKKNVCIFILQLKQAMYWVVNE